MKTYLKVLVIGLLVISCKKEKDSATVDAKVSYNKDLAEELRKMAEVDQIAAYIPQGKYKKWSPEKWNSFKDSVFTAHYKQIKLIFEQHGFVGFDLAGEEGSENFWVMVQHSDHDPAFQKEVLTQMKAEVDKGNAHPKHYAMLVDRVKLNSGEKQVYGTQATYNLHTAQAYPKDLGDSVGVNERRKQIGLEPLEVVLNRKTKQHFLMNKERYLKKGVTEPKLYELKEEEGK